MSDNRPIGVFDSGVGGLTVASMIRQLLPNESIIYFGDTKHLPYGDKSVQTINDYSEQITKFLLSEGCKSIVVACNTASSNALNTVSDIAGKDALVVDMIQPVAEKVAYELHQKIGVIATKATVSSGVYKKQIRKRNKHIKVVELQTPLLVPIIEEGLLKSNISKAIIEHYLSNKRLQNVDSIILGCTHYPLIQKEIQDYYNHKVRVINSPLIVANQLLRGLQKRNQLSNLQEADYTFYLSDYTKNFHQLAKRIFGKQIRLEEKQLSLNQVIPT